VAKYGSILVTGGAGFIGSHVVEQLVSNNFEVIVLDNLEPQVHGTDRKDVLVREREGVTYVFKDIRNRDELARLVKNVDAVIHLAAAVGVGQSMYEIEKYVDSNTRGTAMLLDVLVNTDHNISKLVVASSMSIYGEGKYFCEKCDSFRTPDLRQGPSNVMGWEHACKKCGSNLKPVPTDEDTTLRPTSIYAMSKRHQEEMCILIGRTYDIPTVALRFFNVCGPGQSLSNPYTGAAAIFMSRIANKHEPYIFEDGNQLRDFIHVSDIARACVSALERDSADYLPVNVGTGQPTSIRQIAETLTDLYGGDVKPHITNEFRKGDIRHCYADTRRAKKLLGFESRLTYKHALSDLVQWTKSGGGENAVDMFDKALAQLREKNLA